MKKSSPTQFWAIEIHLASNQYWFDVSIENQKLFKIPCNYKIEGEYIHFSRVSETAAQSLTLYTSPLSFIRKLGTKPRLQQSFLSYCLIHWGILCQVLWKSNIGTGSKTTGVLLRSHESPAGELQWMSGPFGLSEQCKASTERVRICPSN